MGFCHVAAETILGAFPAKDRKILLDQMDKKQK
jgi:hypothetical protein